MWMARQALFAGLVIEDDGQPVEVTMVGDEAFYIVDDDGFQRHIQSEYVDRQVLDHLMEMIQGHEEIITEGTMKMLGQDDIFTKAMIETSLKNVDDQFQQLLQVGLPEDSRAWLGMLGFRVVIDYHGDVIRVDQPSTTDESFD
jgi:hypothetical protein